MPFDPVLNVGGHTRVVSSGIGLALQEVDEALAQSAHESRDEAEFVPTTANSIRTRCQARVEIFEIVRAWDSQTVRSAFATRSELTMASAPLRRDSLRAS